MKKMRIRVVGRHARVGAHVNVCAFLRHRCHKGILCVCVCVCVLPRGLDNIDGTRCRRFLDIVTMLAADAIK